LLVAYGQNASTISAVGILLMTAATLSGACAGLLARNMTLTPFFGTDPAAPSMPRKRLARLWLVVALGLALWLTFLVLLGTTRYSHLYNVLMAASLVLL